jgi:hypothetical protein
LTKEISKMTGHWYRAEFRIIRGGNLQGKTLDESGLFSSPGITLLSWARSDGLEKEILPDRTLEGGDILAFSVPDELLPGL